MKSTNPLVSFCVKSHNQRCYLMQALEGAWAQTYRPLEIVVSDDGSTDGSWDAIRSFAASHPTPAGVTLVLSRNERNLGNLGNWEKLCSLAHGELLIKADGDDVSLPNRTSAIVEAWVRDGKKAYAVCHSGWQMLPDGKPFGRLRLVTAGCPLGAAMAYSPELFRRFPKIDAKYRRGPDDVVFTHRARMLGSVLEIPDRLVKYRVGTGESSTIWRIRNQIRFCHRNTLGTMDIAERDRLSLPEEMRPHAQKVIDADRRRLTLNLCRLDSPSFVERLKCTREIGWPRFFSIAHYMSVAFTLPKPLGDAMLFAYALLRNTYWRLQGGPK